MYTPGEYKYSSGYGDNDPRRWASVPRGFGNQQEYFGTTNRYSGGTSDHRRAGSVNEFGDRMERPQSLEQLYFPKQSQIARNFDVHLESPLFFSGDHISGQVTFDIVAPAVLLVLEVRLFGACVLKFSRSTSANPRRPQVLRTTILDTRDDLLKERPGGLPLKPGRYSFEVSFNLPIDLPSTNDVSGVAQRNEFQTSLSYFAQSFMTLSVDTLDGYSASTGLHSYKTYFHVEKKIPEEELSEISYTVPVRSHHGTSLMVNMSRNVYKPGETIELHLVAGRSDSSFNSADLCLYQELDIAAKKVTQATVVLQDKGVLFTTDRNCYGGLPTCHVSLRLPHTIKPNCEASLTRLTYFIVVKVVYRSSELISVSIPLRIVHILQTDRSKHLHASNGIQSLPNRASLAQHNRNINITHKISPLKYQCSIQ